MVKRLFVLALVLAFPAAGDTLRDAGFGDGSLIDSNGDYFYPQPDGTYLDTYGNFYVPGDADTIDTGFDNPLENGDLEDLSNPDWYPDGLTGPSDGGRARDARSGTRAQNPNPDNPADPADRGERPGMYMDVGSGYLELDTPPDWTDQPLNEDLSTGGDGMAGEPAPISDFATAGPGMSMGDRNASEGRYRQDFLGNQSGEIPKGLMDPHAPGSYEDALRARKHLEVLGPDRDYKPLIPFDRGQRRLH
jgi:hypothetical protein